VFSIITFLFIFFFLYFADRASPYIYPNINQLDALNCIMSLFHASTCLYLCCTWCIDKHTDKIIHIILGKCIHSWFCVLNYISSACRSNAATAARNWTTT